MTLLSLILFFTGIAKAQLINLSGAPSYTESLSRIIENFQNNYYAIQGEALPPDEDRNIFESTVSLPGAERCVIFRFFSKVDTSAGWQATVYEGEDRKEALKMYKHAFNQLKKTKIHLGMYKYSLDGHMETPDETLRFTSSQLRPDIDEGIYKNFIAEVELINEMATWAVRINLHARKADTERY